MQYQQLSYVINNEQDSNNLRLDIFLQIQNYNWMRFANNYLVTYYRVSMNTSFVRHIPYQNVFWICCFMYIWLHKESIFVLDGWIIGLTLIQNQIKTMNQNMINVVWCDRSKADASWLTIKSYQIFACT